MAASLQQTQRLNDGEGQNDEMDLQMWLKQEGLQKIHDILQENELNDLELFKLMTADDVRDVAKTCNLSLADKLKLIKAVKKLQINANSQDDNKGNKAIIMDKEERDSLFIIQTKLDHCHAVIRDINKVNDTLDAESIRCKKEIESAFIAIHKILANRRDSLLTQLESVINTKKMRIQTELEDITAKSLMMKQYQTKCSQLIQKPLEITNIKALEKRKEKIMKITKTVKDITLLSATTQSAEVCLNCDTNDMEQSIRLFGSIYDGKTLSLAIVSLQKGKATFDVDMRWKICIDQEEKYEEREVLQEIKRKNNKMKIEWKEKEAKEWNASDDINVDKSSGTHTVRVLNDGVYLFVMKLFVGLQSISSAKAEKTFVFKECDEWDYNYKSKHIQVTNNNHTVENLVASWRGILGTKQCQSGTGIHHWKLKLNVSKDISNSVKVIVGVCPQQYWNQFNADSSNEYNYLYCFVGSEAKLYSSGCKHTFKHDGSYAVKFENTNDTLDVYLDTDKKTLSFGVNGVKYGDAFRGIEDTTYRLGVSLYPGRSLELL